MGHEALNSKSDFDHALANNPGKYVLVYCYTGTVDPKAEAYSDQFAHTTKAYKVDVSQHAAAKEYFHVATTPTVVIFKDGKEVNRVEGGDEAKMQEVAATLK